MAAINEKNLSFFNFNLLECVYNFVKDEILKRLERVSRDFTDHIDTDEENSEL